MHRQAAAITVQLLNFPVLALIEMWPRFSGVCRPELLYSCLELTTVRVTKARARQFLGVFPVHLRHGTENQRRSNFSIIKEIEIGGLVHPAEVLDAHAHKSARVAWGNMLVGEHCGVEFRADRIPGPAIPGE